jgi:hypothetical protein
MSISLDPVKRTNDTVLCNMSVHYSQPKGFVGRNICYVVRCGDIVYGSIVGGSATLHLDGRDEFFGLSAEEKRQSLRSIVNNIFFHVEKVDDRYPTRNFGQKILKLFRRLVRVDWEEKYGDRVVGFETLVELPRTGDVYLRDGWEEIGLTKGFTCKRVAGKGTDSWSGKRVWNTKELRPKRVFAIKAIDTQPTCVGQWNWKGLD